ncbi:uncharacterized protein BJ171DRAFT_525038 [Polychytrium aggregatum]|uniref:uncharacterized protein n=1 Tax=Polychytrium aggregatum TaxID=110093 RepID=UPI0022FE783E|nr:uncharacterized protein BJ171DRAFT_525038 [Polychytrium aggregatum]KAI9193563.1 hypothetical protein BJ171DRAFT_525038 [Polychytrium aggregatum]
MLCKSLSSQLAIRLARRPAPLRVLQLAAQTAAAAYPSLAPVPTTRLFSTSPAILGGADGKLYTVDKFPQLKRNPKFKAVDSQDLEHFRSIIGPQGVLTDKDEIEPFNEDWLRKYRGKTTVVLRPKTSQQVADILKYCNSQSLAVVPQGGNTGLVGGSVPVFDEIVISTQLMNEIESFDEVSGILTCQAGCVLEKLDDWLAEKGYMMPLDLGAKGSCHIGGNVATNAGGIRLLRYGSLHGTVLSLEVATADGSLMELGKPLRKDNTGLDLKHLFVGSEGVLGMITKVSILTPKRSSAVNVAMFALKDFNAVQEAFKRAKSNLSEILSAYEFFDSASFSLVQKHLHIRDPFSQTAPCYVLIETSGSNKEHDDEKLASFLENLMEDGIIEDGVLAQDSTQMHAFWSIRESISEACVKEGANFKYDLSMPVPSFYELVETMRVRLQEKGFYDPANPGASEASPVKHVVGFGHIGDGNLHLNIVTSHYSKSVEKAIEPYVYEWTGGKHGSISAEHGLGLMKADYLGYSKSPEMIAYMKKIKDLFDPKGILNPYKYLPSQ